MRYRRISLCLPYVVLAFWLYDSVTGLLSPERCRAIPQMIEGTTRLLLLQEGVTSPRRNSNPNSCIAQQAKKPQTDGQTTLEDYSNSDDSTDSSLDSPLSQLLTAGGQEEGKEGHSEEYKHPQAFLRNEKWLEEATADILDHNVYPIGDLTSEDVESISGLMAAWARRGSVHAAMTVERLLKRIVDDNNAGNGAARVSTRQYIYAVDAWARCRAKGSAVRAQHIHDTMVSMYKQTGDECFSPSVISYNHLLKAWGKCTDPKAPSKAENVLSEILDGGMSNVKPDAVTFSTIMDIYSKSNAKDSSKRCEELFNMMDELNVRKNVYTFSALQNVYARSGEQDAPIKAKAILDQMLALYAKGDVFAKPNCLHYNAILHALSRATTRDSADMANDLLKQMELPSSEGGYDIEPDRLSYALTILACSRCKDNVYGAKLAESNLEKLEERTKIEAERRAIVSSAAPPVVSLDVECFNVVLTAISRSRKDDGWERSIRIINRMEEYANNGQPGLRPNIRSWNAVLNCFARAPRLKDPKLAAKVEHILNHVFALHESGIPNVKPDSFTFAAVLCAYQRSSSSDPTAIDRADNLVRKMEQLYENGRIDFPPDVYHYTILCGTWAKSRHPLAAERCSQILAHMVERGQAGFENVTPNVRTYNAVLDCLCRSGFHDRAEGLLYHMLRLYNDGDNGAGPDCFSFNSVIYALCRSKKKGNGKRAESVLERLLEYNQEENPSVSADTRSFSHIIAHYGRSNELDGPYRAEYMLNRMLSAFEDGQKNIAPNNFCFTTVIDSYAYARHPDGGRNAERILQLMEKLMKRYPSLNICLNREVMNSVLHAWSSSGDDDAGRRADAHLNEMEPLGISPDTRSYELVLSAWSKSSSVDKARRSLEVFRRMEDDVRKGSRFVSLDDHAYSLVINACAFSNQNKESELEAFDIALELFNELLDSKTLCPSSLTFGWFIQACGRLGVSDDVKKFHIKRSFQKCCEFGLVNDFVIQRLKGASNDLFECFVGTGKRSQTRGKKKRQMSDFPRHRKRNSLKKRKTGKP